MNAHERHPDAAVARGRGAADVPGAAVGAGTGVSSGPEFAYTHEPHRRRWVIRRRGALYLGISTDDYPERYVQRVVALLNRSTMHEQERAGDSEWTRGH
jgi:hypothetical protein